MERDAAAMKLPFVKLDGAGNDFVGLDWRGKAPLPDDLAGALARLLTDRHHGIGADGVLLLQDPTEPGTDFTMVYLNADGSIGGMCGNGARCIARFAHDLGAAPARMTFLTGAGLYRAEVLEPAVVRVDFPDVPTLPERRAIQGPLRPLESAWYLHVGVPHAVEFVEDLDMVEVATLGREVRHDPAFAPAGTNMNFAEVRNGRLFVRTYERGVEAETKACGTGSVATCCVHAWREKLHGRQQFTINPTGGIPLEIGFTHTETGFYGVTLAGPALRRFEGHVDIDPEITRIGG